MTAIAPNGPPIPVATPGQQFAPQPVQQAPTTQSAFAGSKNAEETKGGNYILPGNHRFLLKGALLKISQNKKKVVGKKFFIVEAETIKSTVHEVGSKRSWLVDFSKPGALGNCKNFGYAVFMSMGYPKEQLDAMAAEQFDAMLDWLAGPNNPLGTTHAGIVCDAEAWHKPTEAGGVFTMVNWTPAPK
jgi:hypothetical protein